MDWFAKADRRRRFHVENNHIALHMHMYDKRCEDIIMYSTVVKGKWPMKAAFVDGGR